MEFPLVSDDPLAVLRSTRPVVQATNHVRIDHGALEQVATRLPQQSPLTVAWGEDLHYRDGTWRTAAWVFVLDALNFCFWSNDPQRRWRISYGGESWDGYWALVAALRRAVDDGEPVWDAAFLRDLDVTTVETMLRPSDPADPPIPLVEERWRNLTELGRGLLHFQTVHGAPADESPVQTLLRVADRSAVRLIEIVRRWFPSFDDAVEWNGSRVVFLKRAQILVADLSAAFSGVGPGAFHDLNELTAFADYKVPQVLRRLGILRYDDALAGLVDSRTLIPARSGYEIEIRAATIWAVELLRQRLAARGSLMAAHEIDWALWQAGQSARDGDRPYHRTLTIFY
ncbi:MAG: queuosine salvage family protein [Thermomicrobiales bacterium]